jgi:hypothetical protein
LSLVDLAGSERASATGAEGFRLKVNATSLLFVETLFCVYGDLELEKLTMKI